MATPEHIIKRVIGPNHTRATVRPGESMLNVVIGTLRDEDPSLAAALEVKRRKGSLPTDGSISFKK
jgi:hypothetical protein